MTVVKRKWRAEDCVNAPTLWLFRMVVGNPPRKWRLESPRRGIGLILESMHLEFLKHRRRIWWPMNIKKDLSILD